MRLIKYLDNGDELVREWEVTPSSIIPLMNSGWIDNESKLSLDIVCIDIYRQALITYEQPSVNARMQKYITSMINASDSNSFTLK